MRFQYDPSKVESNLRKHGVSFADAEGVFYDPLALHRPDPDSEGEERFLAIGLGSAGQLLVVVYTLRGEDIRSPLGLRHRHPEKGETMRPEYEFSGAKRGALLPTKGKTRITIYIDNAVLDEFRSRAEMAGNGYQTMMNEALRAYLSRSEPTITESLLRQVVREELSEIQRKALRAARVRAKTAR